MIDYSESGRLPRGLSNKSLSAKAGRLDFGDRQFKTLTSCAQDYFLAIRSVLPSLIDSLARNANRELFIFLHKLRKGTSHEVIGAMLYVPVSGSQFVAGCFSKALKAFENDVASARGVWVRHAAAGEHDDDRVVDSSA